MKQRPVDVGNHRGDPWEDYRGGCSRMGMTAVEPVPVNIAILAGSAIHLRLLMP